MNNTTSFLIEPNLKAESADNYDTVGAITFIVVVLLWYSVSVALLLGIQICEPTRIVENLSEHQKKLFTRTNHEKIDNREVLEELADKKKRDKLWDIYLGSSADMSEENTRAERLRIHNIRRQLVMMKKTNRDDHERLTVSNEDDSRDLDPVSSVPDIAPIGNPVRTRRHSASGQDLLEEWKITAEGLKVNEQWPWLVRKILIRRHFRRSRHMHNYQTVRRRPTS